MNTPISNQEQDVIGVEKYVDKLDAALDMGAQMVAITAPFGSGKTSVIELLEKRRSEKKEDERIIKLSMWSQLHGDIGSTSELHKSFIYQLVSQIDHKRGTYIGRRLNPNYGLLKMHANKTRYWVLFIIAIVLLALCWGINSFEDDITSSLTCLKDSIDTWKTGLGLAGAILGLIVVTRAEIIYSSIKGNGEARKIESSEIIDLYRDEILKCKKMHYVVVIEDLDRSSDAKAVVGFLKELRKYYVIQTESGKKKGTYRNKVSFIVNVKPEALLVAEANVPDKKGEGQGNVQVEELGNRSRGEAIEENESLYAKLFDYVLNLQTINIDNYDAVLEGILEEKRAEIEELGFDVSKLVELPGMKWIIRERRLGIREIKERLNIAFSLFESLKNKFEGDTTITLEKCAVVAYLTTAYEKDFYKTKDRAFQELVNLKLKGELTYETCKVNLEGTSDEYISTIIELVDAKHIDGSYRTYFYNYPKGSYLYTSDESQIVNAILYKEQVDDLERVAVRVNNDGSEAPQRALQSLKQLGLPLPATVFQSETLYAIALKQDAERVLQYIENMDYSADSVQKHINFFKKILSYDKARDVYTKEIAAELCGIWEEKLSENAIGQLRLALCKDFSAEIMWYRPLFFGVHKIINEAEMELISFGDAISLIDYEDDEFDYKWPKYILNKFEGQLRESDAVEAFLREAGDYLTDYRKACVYLEYMDKKNCIVPDFEQVVFAEIRKESVKSELREELFELFQKIINRNVDCLSERTIEFVSKLERFSGYDLKIAFLLKDQGHYKEYILVLLEHQKEIPFKEEMVRECIKANVEFIRKHGKFMEIRKLLCALSESVLLQYEFMFDKNQVTLSKEEIQIIQENHADAEDIVMQLLPAESVSEMECEMLCQFFNRKKHTNNVTYTILRYISDFEPKIARKIFFLLDFDMVRYQFLSKEKKTEVKEWFKTTLTLDKAVEKINFMKATKYLDNEWEGEMLELLKTDKNLQVSYINLVNSSGKITRNTINNICRIGCIYPMSTIVNQKFFENKRYKEYVVSEMLQKKQFVMPEDKREVLWQTYIDIFSSTGFVEVRKYMVQNKEFIRLIMESKSYQGYSEANRMQLVEVYQDRECLEDVLNYGDEFALKYYSSIAGFADEEAATAFVSIVEANDVLLDSDELYVKTHGMLVNGRLKAKYTNARKRRGHMRE